MNQKLELYSDTCSDNWIKTRSCFNEQISIIDLLQYLANYIREKNTFASIVIYTEHTFAASQPFESLLGDHQDMLAKC